MTTINSKPANSNDSVSAEPATTADNTVTLETPIQRGASTIDTITLRKPKAGELRGLNLTDILQMNVASLEALIPRISQPTLTKADVANMDPADLVNCGAVVTAFLLTKAEKASAFPVR